MSRLDFLISVVGDILQSSWIFFYGAIVLVLTLARIAYMYVSTKRSKLEIERLRKPPQTIILATSEEVIRYGKDSAFRNHLKRLSSSSFLTILIVIVVLALALPGKDLIQKIDAAKNALGLPVSGCMDPSAENYNKYATSQTGVTCTYPKAQAK